MWRAQSLAIFGAVRTSSFAICGVRTIGLARIQPSPTVLSILEAVTSSQNTRDRHFLLPPVEQQGERTIRYGSVLLQSEFHSGPCRALSCSRNMERNWGRRARITSNLALSPKTQNPSRPYPQFRLLRVNPDPTIQSSRRHPSRSPRSKLRLHFESGSRSRGNSEEGGFGGRRGRCLFTKIVSRRVIL